MLRVLIGGGVLLMLVGFGAAGWQYWQGSPAAGGAALPGGAAAAPGAWLGTATGGIVPAADARAFLVQDRFVPTRTVTLTREAPLTQLLRAGETLPEPVFLPVFADIRAPELARALCPVLTDRIAAACAVNAARLVEGSVRPAEGTARFRIELVYRLRPDPVPLPELGAHVFASRTVTPGAEAGAGAEAGQPPAATVEAALAAVVEAAQSACLAQGGGDGGDGACRILRLSLDWAPGAPFAGSAEIGWLSPLPDGVFAAPAVIPAPEG